MSDKKGNVNFWSMMPPFPKKWKYLDKVRFEINIQLMCFSEAF